ncbi:MAG: aminoacyl--tRNA ligase-related protein [Patescibacteria group bacterium]
MRQSGLFSKTSKTSEADAQSANHDFLVRAGFVDQLMAGVYSYLPLGVRVLSRISRIVREEMDRLGGQEVSLPALHPKENWQKTGRWDSMDVLFKVPSRTASEYALGPTHEEVIVPLARKHIASYRDLPRAWYQIQTKFRDELRPKAGLLRGREFLMKDLYSFHADAADLKLYYEKAKKAYTKVFKRCGLDAVITEASGGSFTKEYSHEFQVPTENGEDLIFTCSCGFARNKEIMDSPPARGGDRGGGRCPVCGKKDVKAVKSIEVGNIFDLGTKFSKDFSLKFTDEDGSSKEVIIGCYGIGISRLMGAIVEVHHDEAGIIWPEEVAPYAYHLVSLGDDDAAYEQSEKVYAELVKSGKEVLWDDRRVASNAEKLADADLIGIPTRLVISPKTEGKIEVKKRGEDKTKLVNSTSLRA